MRNSRVVAVVAVLSVLSLVLRRSVAFNGGLWRDEALFLGVVRLPSWGAMVDFLRLHESHPPLFYALTRVWLAVFGNTDGAALALPLLFGVALVPAVYAVGLSLFGTRAGLVGATLVTLLPSVTEDGSAARPYSLLTLLALFSVYALIRAIDSGGRTWWSLYAAGLVAMVYTHNWAWVLVAAMVIAHPLYAKGARGSWKGLALALATVAAAYLPWLSSLIQQSRVAGHSGLPAEGVGGIATLIGYAALVTTNATVVPPVTGGRGILLAACFIASVILALGFFSPERFAVHEVPPPSAASSRLAIRVLGWTCLAAIVIATAASPTSNMLVGRCLSSLGPLLLLIVAAWSSTLSQWYSGDGRRVAVVAALGVTVAGAYAAGLYDLLTRPRSNAREVARAMNALERPGDLVLIVPGWLSSSFNHYSDRTTGQIAFPDSGGTELFDFANLWTRFQDTSALAATERRIAEVARANGRVWLVTDAVSYGPLMESDVKLALHDHVASSMAKVRTADIRRILDGAFGEPAKRVRHNQPPPRQEQFLVDLYKRGDADARR